MSTKLNRNRKVNEETKEIKMCAERGRIEDDPVQKIRKSFKGKSPKNKKNLRAAFLKNKIWPAGTTLKIAFLEEPIGIKRTKIDVMRKSVDANGVSLKIDPLQETIDSFSIVDGIIKTITERLQPIINIKLKFHDEAGKLFNPNVADIRISFDPYGGAWSYLGTDILTYKDKEEATMNFGWFDVPTTLHEFCHALGMVHEHSNPNGNLINWDEGRVYKWAKDSQGWDKETTKANIIERYKKDEINGSQFDSKSIMLYFFPGTLTNDVTSGKCCGKGTSQNLMFSPFDVMYLNKIYPKEGSDLTPDQFAVKFFNDVFNQQIDPKILDEKTDSFQPKDPEPEETNKQRSTNPPETKDIEDKDNNSVMYAIIAVILLSLIFYYLYRRNKSQPASVNSGP